MGEIIATVLSWFGITLPSVESDVTANSSRDEFPGRRQGG